MTEINAPKAPANDDAEFVALAGEAQALLGFGRFALAIPHRGVEAVLAHQVDMGATFGDLTVLEHDDLVGRDQRPPGPVGQTWCGSC